MFLNQFLFQRPKETFFRFSAQGKGINRRAHLYATDWESHYENSRKQIADWLDSKSTETSLNILGAGPLNDVPLKSIKRFVSLRPERLIVVTDANIDYLNTWRTKLVGIPHQSIVQDVSLRLEKWLTSLHNSNFANYDKFLVAVNEVSKDQKANSQDFFKADLNISLNLLSQIPIHWQEAVFSLSRRKFGRSMTLKRKDDLLQSLDKSSSFLIESHLNQLVPTGRNKSNLLLFDFKSYFPDKNLLKIELKTETAVIFPEALFHFKNNSKNIILEQDSLYSFDITKWLSERKAEMSYRLIDSWIWKVVPETSIKEKTEFHTVVCLELIKR